MGNTFRREGFPKRVFKSYKLSKYLLFKLSHVGHAFITHPT